MGLVLSGGDVAAKVLYEVGATVMYLQGEIRPAMPWGVVEFTASNRLIVVTKAGSFGDDDALGAFLNFLVRLNHVKH